MSLRITKLLMVSNWNSVIYVEKQMSSSTLAQIVTQFAELRLLELIVRYSFVVLVSHFCWFLFASWWLETYNEYSIARWLDEEDQQKELFPQNLWLKTVFPSQLATDGGFAKSIILESRIWVNLADGIIVLIFYF